MTEAEREHIAQKAEEALLEAAEDLLELPPVVKILRSGKDDDAR